MENRGSVLRESAEYLRDVGREDRRGVSGSVPLYARMLNMGTLNATRMGAMSLSLSNIFFHCFASRGAGARRRAGVVEKDWEKVLPKRAHSAAVVLGAWSGLRYRRRRPYWSSLGLERLGDSLQFLLSEVMKLKRQQTLWRQWSDEIGTSCA